MNLNKNKIFLIYDDDCGICEWCKDILKNSFVKDVVLEVIGKDDDFAKNLLQSHHLSGGIIEESVVVIENEKTFTHSDALILLLSYTKWCIKILYYLFLVIPKPILNFGYKIFAKNRHRISFFLD